MYYFVCASFFILCNVLKIDLLVVKILILGNKIKLTLNKIIYDNMLECNIKLD